MAYLINGRTIGKRIREKIKARIAQFGITPAKLGLVYGGFTYTKETHDVGLGPMELSVEEKERVNVPVWAGVVGVVAGTGLVLAGRRSGK